MNIEYRSKTEHRVDKKCLYCDDSNLEYIGLSPDTWVGYYKCNCCSKYYLFIDNDMGQTSDHLEHIKNIPSDMIYHKQEAFL